MLTSIPDQQERHEAEEAEILETAATPELYDEETTRTMVRSIISDPESLKAIIHSLFANPDFKKFLAMSFVSIYDNFVKMTNNALQDFENIFEVRFTDGSTGNPHEFNVVYHADDNLEFFTIDELGNRVTYKEQHPGVKASTLKSLASVNAKPDSGIIYTAIIAEREVKVNFEGDNGSIVTAETLQQAIDNAQPSAGIENTAH